MIEIYYGLVILATIVLIVAIMLPPIDKKVKG